MFTYVYLLYDIICPYIYLYSMYGNGNRILNIVQVIAYFCANVLWVCGEPGFRTDATYDIT